jgi:Cu-Zn family superoxide dismutase
MKQLLQIFAVFILATFVSTQTTVTDGIAVMNGVGNAITGTVTLSQSGGVVTVTVDIMGIETNPDGEHGIHIHAFGDLRGLITTGETIGANVLGGLTVGGHYNPYNAPDHGCPDGSGNNLNSHAGDLGNWKATAGAISLSKDFTNITLDGSSTSVVGRAVVLHANQDDCMNISSSGGRIAIGVIGIKNPGTGNTNNAAPAAAGLTSAVCVLQGTDTCVGSSCDFGSAGFVVFSQTSGSTVINVQAKVYGINTERGFHIHQYGDISNSAGTAAGGHWNPDGSTHGLPGDTELHAGDMGSIKTFQDGDGFYDNNFDYSDTWWTIDDLIGRAIIVHQGLDHGNEPTCTDANLNGAAGPRDYQCVIGVPNSADQTNTDNLLPTVDTTGLTFDNNWENVPCTAAPTEPTAAPNAGSIFCFSILTFLVSYVLSLIF